MKDHSYYMKQALAQARRAAAVGEVPVGAVVVNQDGVIIGRGYNQVEKQMTQMAHAECNAIRKATRAQANWRLNGCWLYVTLEPCAMCMGLIELSRLEGVVYGADSPQFGFQLDKEGQVPLYKRNALHIVKHIGKDESVNLLKNFFHERRKQRG